MAVTVAERGADVLTARQPGEGAARLTAGSTFEQALAGRAEGFDEQVAAVGGSLGGGGLIALEEEQDPSIIGIEASKEHFGLRR